MSTEDKTNGNEAQSMVKNDDDSFVGIEFNDRKTFTGFSEKIYSSDKSAIQEVISNGVSSVVGAKSYRDGDAHLEDVGFYVMVEYDEENKKLRIYDSGVGVDEDIIEDYMTTGGMSGFVADESMMGRFGYGFLSIFRLSDGSGIKMWSRNFDGTETKGVWSKEAGGFMPDVAIDNVDEKLWGSMERGTLFEIPVGEMFSSTVEKAVKKFKYSRVPVYYIHVDEKEKETDSDGNVKHDEDGNVRYDYDGVNGNIVGGESLSHRYQYSGQNPFTYSIIEDEYEIFISPHADSTVNMIDRIIDSGYNTIISDIEKYGYSIDLQVNNEHGIVISGPNEGKIPLTDVEYSYKEDEEDEDIEDYIRETELEEDDVRLPYPSATRENIEYSQNFLDYLDMRLSEVLSNSLEGVVHSLDEDMSFQSLRDSQQELLYRYIWSNVHDELSIDEAYCLLRDIEKYLEFEEGTLQDLCLLFHKTRNQGWRENIYSFYKSSSNEEVWFGCTINSDKKEKVEDDGIVLEIANSTKTPYESSDEMYEALKGLFNDSPEWDILKEVEVENTSSSTPDNVQDRELSVHKNRMMTGSTKMSVSEIEEEVGEEFDYFVLFPRGTNLSGGIHIASRNTRVANCINKVADYFKDVDNVYTYEEYLEAMKNTEIELLEEGGTIKAKEIDSDAIVYLLSSKAYEYYRDEEQLDEMFEAIHDLEIIENYTRTDDRKYYITPYSNKEVLKVGSDARTTSLLSSTSNRRLQVYLKINCPEFVEKDEEDEYPEVYRKLRKFSSIHRNDMKKKMVDGIIHAHKMGMDFEP